MKRCGLGVAAALFVFLFTAVLFSGISARAEDGKEYETFLKQRRGIYSNIINFLREEQKSKKVQSLTFNDSVALFGADSVISLFFLGLALFFLINRKSITIKGIIWFLVAINLSWFACLFFFRILWDILYFLVVRLRPDLGPPITDSFSVIFIAVSASVYIWLLARTFHLNFYGASGVFLLSHFLYLLVIFLFFSFAGIGEEGYLNLLKGNLGTRAIIQSYLFDLDKVVSSRNVLSCLRFRPYHL